MTLRKGVAVAAVAAIGFLTIPSEAGIWIGTEALAKGSGDHGHDRHAEAPPVADAGRDAVAAVGDTVVLDGSGSTDPEAEELGYAWRVLERPVTSQTALSDPAAPKPSFVVDADGRYLFELVVVSDEEAYSTPDIVEINTGDVAPAADAGPDAQVMAETTATLDGAGSSDAGGDRVHYNWRLVSQPAGSAASLSEAAAVRPTIAVDMAGEYVAELEVNDGVANSMDRVTLSTGPVAPSARAGADQPATPFVPLVLDAELTGDADGDILAFDWALLSAPAESEAEIARRHARRAAFMFSDPGTYVLQLTVSDAGGDVAQDTVVVSTGNVPPVADAGPDYAIASGTRLRLDASRSTDLDGDRLQFRWALLAAPEGSAAALGDPAGVRPWFTPDLDGTYVLQLAVWDGSEWSAPDSVVLSTGNLPPIADAGPDRWQKERGVVTLDGLASSDANGDALNYRWALLDGPRGSRAALADPAAAETSFVADRRGTYLAQLVVDDGTAESAPSLVVIGVGKGAWGDEKDSDYDDFDDFDRDDDDDDDHEADDDDDDEEKKHNKRAALDGIRIIPAGYTLPKGAKGKGHEEHGEGHGYGHEEHGNGHGYGHYEDDDDDDAHGGKQAGFSGHPGDVNIRPVAAPGAGQRLPTGAAVQLDGSQSSDANGDALTYRWDLIVAPGDSTAELDDPASPTPSFTADVSGVYVAQLVVFDGLMASFPRTVAVLANTAPVADAGPDLEVDAGTTALLDGTGSFDPDGDPLTYRWTVIAYPAGGTTQIDDATSPVASFTPNVDGIYEVQLVVNDGIENSAPDTAIITVFSNPPVAEAGDDQVVVVGEPAILDGSALYDPDGQDITYSWRFTARPKDSVAALDDATLARPRFTPDKEGLYILELVVSDGRLESRPDVVGVRAWSGEPNLPPVLDDIGDQMVVLGSSMSLTLKASDQRVAAAAARGRRPRCGDRRLHLSPDRGPGRQLHADLHGKRRPRDGLGIRPDHGDDAATRHAHQSFRPAARRRYRRRCDTAAGARRHRFPGRDRGERHER
jgi:PKD repeat protein